jgi:chemotaxis protein methyltransferase CheR
MTPQRKRERHNWLKDPVGLRMLSKRIEAQTGLDCSQFRQTYLERRLQTRLRAHKVSSYQEYLRILNKFPEELEKLLSALTINLTEFFRDKDVFDYLERKILPELVKGKLRRGHSQLRIWSAGCATGEEPYSIAITVDNFLDQRKLPKRFIVYATDIDKSVLEQAQEGLFSPDRLQKVPLHYCQRYFSRDVDGFRISKELASHVKFKKLDLFAENIIRAVDLAFCRNVLIYFARDQQEKVINKFYKAILPGGYLILGKTEKLLGEIAKKFRLVDVSRRIYQKVKEES